MLGFYPEAMKLLVPEKICTTDEWLKAIRRLIRKKEQCYINEHFSEVTGTLLLIDSKNNKIYNLQEQELIVYQFGSSHDEEE